MDNSTPQTPNKMLNTFQQQLQTKINRTSLLQSEILLKDAFYEKVKCFFEEGANWLDTEYEFDLKIFSSIQENQQIKGGHQIKNASAINLERQICSYLTEHQNLNVSCFLAKCFIKTKTTFLYENTENTYQSNFEYVLALPEERLCDGFANHLSENLATYILTHIPSHIAKMYFDGIELKDNEGEELECDFDSFCSDLFFELYDNHKLNQ